ncbi:TonB-linked outer membrane protein, SusC/RagA family [Fodinibius sediminis]|uniref:TonB-linked outer membrane protein, SusC/RagA family n=1 Tax=Fodinibius sediminis TaxID=1214077 RepID=A0A521BVP7_9BACT|nr:TonB-linked outer membrane protein, SusC/RagA family [Fodinibius sediminis]
MKYVKRCFFKVILPVLCLFLMSSFSQAQTLGSLHLTPVHTNGFTIEGGMNLGQALKEMERQYNVVFLYRTDTMSGKKIGSTKILSSNVEKALNKLLEGQGLQYKYLNPKTYGIYEVQEEVNREDILPVQEQVAGTVTDVESGETLPGVNILVKGTSRGASTDSNGDYQLTVPSLQDTLVFTYIGYQRQEVPIGGRTELDVALQPQAIAGEELVVVGYGTMRKTDLAGAVSTVNEEEFERVPTTNPLMSLQGRSAGLRIVSNSGLPGASASIRVRGEQSIRGSNSPIFVVDGNITNNIDHINHQDIESVSVLKDASAVAIYGSRGANGVILVNTKRGSNDAQPAITFHTYGAVQEESNLKLDLLNADEFLEIYTEAYTNMGVSTPWDQEDLAQYQGVNSDWYGEMLSPGYLSNSNLSVSGGSDKSTYFVSTNYTNHQGMVMGTDYDEINLRLNTDHQIRDWLTFGNSLNLFSSKRNRLNG